MRKLVFLSALFTLVLSACEKHNCEPQDNYASLRIVNETVTGCRNSDIQNVRLIGYSFALRIDNGEERTFVLDEGIDGGLKDVDVSVTWRRNGTSYGYTKTIAVDFEIGKTTSIRAYWEPSGGFECGGSGDYALEVID